MTSRPWPDFRPGVLGSIAAWWRALRTGTRPAHLADPALVGGFDPNPPVRRPEEFATPLPSLIPGLDFQAAFTVSWRTDLRSGPLHSNPRSVALHEVVRRASAITSTAVLAHHEVVAHRLGAELGRELHAPDSSVWVRVEEVALTVDPVDVDLSRRHLELERTRSVRQAERDLERAELQYLKHEVLADLATATVWWLRHNDNRVERLAEVVPRLSELVEIVTRRPDQHWADSLARALEAAIPDLTELDRQDMRRRLVGVLGAFGRPETAAEFAQRVDLPPGNELGRELGRELGNELGRELGRELEAEPEIRTGYGGRHRPELDPGAGEAPGSA